MRNGCAARGPHREHRAQRKCTSSAKVSNSSCFKCDHLALSTISMYSTDLRIEGRAVRTQMRFEAAAASVGHGLEQWHLDLQSKTSKTTSHTVSKSDAKGNRQKGIGPQKHKNFFNSLQAEFKRLVQTKQYIGTHAASFLFTWRWNGGGQREGSTVAPGERSTQGESRCTPPSFSVSNASVPNSTARICCIHVVPLLYTEDKITSSGGESKSQGEN